METKMLASSLIDETDIPGIESKSKEPEQPKASSEIEASNGKKASKRRKAKPYEALTQVGRRIAEKKAEKKAKKEGKYTVHKTAIAKSNGKASTVKVVKKASSKKEPKPVKSKEKAGKIIAQGSGVSTGSEHCARCGKKLSRGTSISDGMGPECARKIKLLPAGVSLEDHKASYIVVDHPGKDWITTKEAGKLAAKKGVSGYRFMIAFGGNGLFRPPLSDAFRVVMYKNTRYISKASVSDKELAKLKN